MKAIEFKKRGLLYWMHKFAFTKDSSDTCSYKGELIMSCILILITIHASLIRGIFFLFPEFRKYKDNLGAKNHLLFFLATFLGFIVGHALSEDSPYIPDFIYWTELMANNEWFTIFIMVFLVMIEGIIIISLILTAFVLVIGTCWFIFKGALWIWRKGLSPVINPTYKNDYDEPETQLGVLYTSAKEKWCKKINWK